MDALPFDVAMELCEAIREEQRIKWFTQCWGCTTFSHGDVSKMCGAVVACNLVLKRYQRHHQKTRLPRSE